MQGRSSDIQLDYGSRLRRYDVAGIFDFHAIGQPF